MSQKGKPMSGPTPVPPNSVRVWRGFRHPGLPFESFVEKLGSIFIPGTVQIQSPVGLTAYLPTVLPKDKPAAAPDEVALVFYEYQKAYDEAKMTVGGRAYSDLHALVFDLKRSLSGFPDKFEGTIANDEKYYLFDTEVDWQVGAVNVFVGVRPADVDPAAFQQRIAQWLTGIQQDSDGPDGAIASASEEFIVYWEHWPDESAAGGSGYGELAQLSEKVHSETIPAVPLSEELWGRYDGFEVSSPQSFNFEFARRKQNWQPTES